MGVVVGTHFMEPSACGTLITHSGVAAVGGVSDDLGASGALGVLDNSGGVTNTHPANAKAKTIRDT